MERDQADGIDPVQDLGEEVNAEWWGDYCLPCNAGCLVTTPDKSDTRVGKGKLE